MSEEEYEFDEAQYEAEVAEIVKQYRKRMVMLHMIGPVISLVLHIIVLSAMSVLVKGKERNPEPPPVVAETVELEIEEIEEILIEEVELEPEENEVFEDIAEVAAPEAPAEEASDLNLDSLASDLPTDTGADLGDIEVGLELVADSLTSLVVTGNYATRSAEGRGSALSKFGGDGRTEDAVIKALKWLKTQQQSNGSWANDPAHTGLALLAFLAHGETPMSVEFGDTVRMGMQWLANDVGSGNLMRKYSKKAYRNGIATYALSEAYGMTQIPFIKQSMEHGLETIIKGQQSKGGFDYDYRKGDRWDLSVAGWQVQALKAGFAAGATNEGLHEAIEKSERFLVQDCFKKNGFAYASGNGRSENLTGTGAVCLQLMGKSKTKEVKAALEFIGGKRLTELEAYDKRGSDGKKFEDSGMKVYGWYYDTQAMFNSGGRDWKSWNKVFKDVLTKSQNRQGYWEIKDNNHFKDDEGRILSTTWSVLQLEVYYRYLPSFNIANMKQTQKSSAADDILKDAGLIIE